VINVRVFLKFFQRLALSISPRWEHRAIMEGGRVKRFQVKANFSHLLIANLSVY